MFEKYTNAARRVIWFAREEAGAAGHPQIEPEDLLLGLWRQPAAIIEGVFPEIGVSSETLRQELSGATLEAVGGVAPGDIPFAKSTQQVLRSAIDESLRLGHTYVGTEHLLLGLLSSENTAASALRAHGMSLETARERIDILLSKLSSQTAQAGKAVMGARLRLGGILEAIRRLRSVSTGNPTAIALIDHLSDELSLLVDDFLIDRADESATREE